jgi:threonine aldolase
MVGRLKEDHDNARKLAIGLKSLGTFDVELRTVQTNIVLIDVSPLDMDSEQFVEKLKRNGILAADFGGCIVRFVTHRGITSKDIDEAIGRIERLK